MDLAELFGVDKSYVTHLYQKKIIARRPDGKFNLIETVRTYIEHLRKSVAPAEDKVRLLRSRADQHEMELARRRGELIPADAVSGSLNAAMAIVSAGLDGLYARLPSELAGMTDPGLIRQRLRTECHTIRTTAADKLAAYAVTIDDDKRPPAARKRNAAGRGNTKTAAAANGRPMG